MRLRIAAIQLHYLPAYFDGAEDYLAEPLVSVPSLEDASVAAQIREWRLHLRSTYCRLFLRKLEAIVSYCAAAGCRLLVFPEYSVPVECLDRLRQLSLQLKLAILAGSARMRRNHPGLSSVLPELDVEQVHGRAVATIFDGGHATFITKVHPSRYDPGVGANPAVAGASSGRIVIEGMALRVWICSDFLAAGSPEDCNPDVAVIISNTPALGDFAVRIQDSTEEEAIGRAYRLQKQGHGSVFVNNADRGGTKTFFDNRESASRSMEAADGTWGQCDILGSRVVRCGIPAGTEGIVITDVVKEEKRVAFRQHAVVPIIHCSGPEDSETNDLTELIKACRASGSIESRVRLLRSRVPLSLRGGKQNAVLRAMLADLESRRESVGDADVLDRMFQVCVVHEEAPSLEVWRHRASGVTLDVLRGLPSGSVDARAIQECIDRCLEKAERLEAEPQPAISESAEVALAGPVMATEWLELSGPFRRGIASSRSGSSALTYAVVLVRHLLAAGELGDARRVIDQAQRLRPYFALHVLDDLRAALLVNSPDVASGIASCESFLQKRHEDHEGLRKVCRTSSASLKGSIVAYGFSEVALTLLSAMSPPRPAVFVAECRNRGHIESGSAYAQKIDALGFPVVYVSDATLARVMRQRDNGVGTVLMGFNVAGAGGVINTIGSLGVAILAKEFGVDLVFAGQSFKIVTGARWDGLLKRSLESQGDAWWLDAHEQRRLSTIGVSDPKSDLVPWEFVDRLISEVGVQSGASLKRQFGSTDAIVRNEQ